MHLNDFNYELPARLVARFPLPERSASRLLCLNSEDGSLTHGRFTDVMSLINPEDLLVMNNTRVIPARLIGNKESGARVEVFVERIIEGNRILAQMRSSKTAKPQTILIFPNQVRFQVLGRRDDLFELQCLEDKPVLEVIEAIGQIPLPPYLQREPLASDKERYQTVYAEHKGSVAAPTAGLHFDLEFIEKLKEKGVDVAYLTLHVGAGTFAPVRVDDIKEHSMHAEYVEVSEELCEKIKATKARGGRVIAVGTTTARSLETASLSGEIQPFMGDTNIFIYPGFEFKCVDALITNFHLPCSTLIMLVAALGGYENVMNAYDEAVAQRYRFFSYGDAMFVA